VREFLRKSNRRVAAGYDFWPWAHDHPEGLDPVSVQLRGKPFGGSGACRDVLDIGCGTGRLLRAAAERCSGKLVGTDISPISCDIARENLKQFGNRCEIINADILDLEAAKLGQFDLIYCTGVISILLPTVRQRLIEVIGECLRPGGSVLISYYAGLGAAIRGHLSEVVRSIARSDADPMAQTRAGRAVIEELKTAAERQNQFALGLRAAFRHFDALEDDIFFAEVLNGDFRSATAGDLNRCFREFGIHFARYVGFAGFKPSYSPADRAMLADRLDLVDGRHRYAIFVKPFAGEAHPPTEIPAATDLPTPSDRSRRPLRAEIREGVRHLFWLVFRV
jgi:SAM-dependent methyltransferase